MFKKCLWIHCFLSIDFIYKYNLDFLNYCLLNTEQTFQRGSQSANFFVKVQKVNILGFVGQTVSVTTTELDLYRKQPEIIHKWKRMAVFQQKFV